MLQSTSVLIIIFVIGFTQKNPRNNYKGEEMFSKIKTARSITSVLVLILLVTVLVPTTEAKSKDQNTTLSYELDYQTMISVPFKNRMTAEKFCNLDERIEKVSKHKPRTNDFKEYDCKDPVKRSNFIMRPHRGYFVKSAERFTLEIEGRLVRKEYNLRKLPGQWNLVGFNFDSDKEMMASDICNLEVNGGDKEIHTVWKYENSGYVSHFCPVSGVPVVNDFEITNTAGYFIRIEDR